MKYLTLFVVFALVVIQGHHGWARFSVKPQSQDFDILLLTQTWLPAICKTRQQYSLPYYCTVTDNYDRWSIHGLWPHKRSGATPEFCADTPLNDEKIATMRKELEHNWVDVFAVNAKQIPKMRDFWEKQWKKHGTCAVKPTDKTAQFDYFKKTLYLFKRYNMNDILRDANIVPGKEYTYYELSSKIEEKVGKECQIACYTEEDTIDETSAIQYLKEIRICFGRDFMNPTHCGRSRLPSCRRNSKIIYLDANLSNNRASMRPNQMSSPTNNAPRTNPSGIGPRDYSFGIGSQGVPNRFASALMESNQIDAPTNNAPRTNPSGIGPRDYSFGIGSQGAVIREASAPMGSSQINAPTGNAPGTNPSGIGPRDYSFGIGSQGAVIRDGP